MQAARSYTLVIKRFTKWLLIFVIACLLLSSCITLALANNILHAANGAVPAFAFVWYSIYAALFILLLCLLGIVILILSFLRNKLPLWPAIKTELGLLIAGIACMIILHFCCLAL